MVSASGKFTVIEHAFSPETVQPTARPFQEDKEGICPWATDRLSTMEYHPLLHQQPIYGEQKVTALPRQLPESQPRSQHIDFKQGP